MLLPPQIKTNPKRGLSLGECLSHPGVAPRSTDNNRSTCGATASKTTRGAEASNESSSPCWPRSGTRARASASFCWSTSGTRTCLRAGGRRLPRPGIMYVMYITRTAHVMHVMHVMRDMHVIYVMYVLHVRYPMYVLYVLYVLHVLHVLHVLDVMCRVCRCFEASSKRRPSVRAALRRPEDALRGRCMCTYLSLSLYVYIHT